MHKAQLFFNKDRGGVNCCRLDAAEDPKLTGRDVPLIPDAESLNIRMVFWQYPTLREV